MKKNRIIIFDTTLRDGEQCPGASMTLREKLEVARQLARLKVDVIEGGFPVISEGDFTAVNTIAREIKGPTIAGLARCVPKDIRLPERRLRRPAKKGAFTCSLPRQNCTASLSSERRRARSSSSPWMA